MDASPRCNPDDCTPTPPVNQRTVCILLECILVSKLLQYFFSDHSFRYHLLSYFSIRPMIYKPNAKQLTHWICDPRAALRCVILLVWHMMDYRRYDFRDRAPNITQWFLYNKQKSFSQLNSQTVMNFLICRYTPTVSPYFVPETVLHAD